MVRERDRKRCDLNHLSVHQWLRSAIRDSQQPTSPIGFLFLKLPPRPCAVLMVPHDEIVELHFCFFTWTQVHCGTIGLWWPDPYQSHLALEIWCGTLVGVVEVGVKFLWSQLPLLRQVIGAPLVAVLLLNSHGLFEDFSVAGLWQSCRGWRVMPTLACFGTTCLWRCARCCIPIWRRWHGGSRPCCRGVPTQVSGSWCWGFLFGPTKCWIKPAMEISGPCWQQSCYCLVFTFFRSVHVAAVNVSPTYSSSRVSRGLPSSDLWNQKLRGGLSGCVLRTKCCVWGRETLPVLEVGWN